MVGLMVEFDAAAPTIMVVVWRPFLLTLELMPGVCIA